MAMDTKFLVNLSPTSPVSDGDAYNIASARIYFGPLQSPEKNLIKSAARLSTPRPISLESPPRRSPRLSAAAHKSHLVVEVGDTEEGYRLGDGSGTDSAAVSRSGTPENGLVLQEEPSLILATKISRAHDNPSPPPRTSHFKHFPIHARDAVPIDISDSPRSPHLYTELPAVANADQRHTESTVASIPFVITDGSPQSSPPSSHDTRLALSRSSLCPDLISFEPMATPPTGRQSNESLIVPTDPSSGGSTTLVSDNRSVDDLLLRSPSPRHFPLPPSPPPLGAPPFLTVAIQSSTGHSGTNGKAEGEERRVTTPESVDEQAVADSLTLIDTEDTSSRSSARSQSPTMSSTPPPPQEQTPQTPVRRSTRPRHSVTPMQVHVINSDAEDSDSRSYLVPPSATNTRKKRKGKERATSPNGNTSEIQVSRSRSGAEGGAADQRVRIRQESATPQPNRRELGSLSPPSADLLARLLPSSSGPSPILEDPAQDGTSIYTLQPILPTPFFLQAREGLAPQTPIRSTSPVRFSSQVRNATFPNPRLQPAALDDPTRTPARRIPIEQAVAEGQISPQKAARMFANNPPPGVGTGPGTSRTPVFTIRPTDSPARRVNISDAATPSKAMTGRGLRFGTPVHGVSKERGASEEPRSLGSPNLKAMARSRSMEPRPNGRNMSSSRPGTSISNRQGPRRLPFPLVASGSDLPKSILEEDENTGHRDVLNSIKLALPTSIAPPSNPVKSNMKQPSSKIPRFGLKPYARPATTRPMEKEARKGGVMRAVDLSKGDNASVVKPLKAGSNADVTMRDGNAKASSSKLSGGKAMEIIATTLKRKRGPDKTSPLNKPRPVVLLRQVPSISGHRSPTKPTAAVKKPPGALKIRRVIDLEPGNEPSKPSSPVRQDRVEGKLEREPLPSILEEFRLPTSSDIDELPSGSGNEKINRPEPSPPHVVEATEETNVRRTTRVRKSIRPAAIPDVFGAANVRPTQPRRKANIQASETMMFAGMSAVALKALTSSNTVRNQKYLAAKLETEVVRKEGDRPGSPTVKVRTVLQRQREEKGKERKERVERRRKLQDGSAAPGEGEGHSEFGDSSMVDSDWEDADQDGEKHMRGPGDEEDYETPARPTRHTKRPRVGDGGEEPAEVKRRVKWDRGLYTTIYLDELKPGTRLPPKENIAKGCLAPAAKALQLDTLGNLHHAESPLTNLVQENIVVKKFVYDNDVEAAAPPTVVKNTRSKSKKQKI